jgi:small subunit ribosomal protein S8
MDKVADMLTAIYNAQAVRRPVVEVPFSGLKYEVAKVLREAGFVSKIDKKNKKEAKNAKPKPSLEIELKYNDLVPAISGYKKVSKPGQRIYQTFTSIRRVKQGHGIGIFSTSKGLLTDRQARKKKIGGEYLCEVW